MIFTEDDYFPPLKGELDSRRLAMFADNSGLEWGFTSERVDGRLKVTVQLGEREYAGEPNADDQAALDDAIDRAIAAA